MKRLLACLMTFLIFFTVGCNTNSGTPQPIDPLTSLQEKMKSTGKLMGVAYLGEIEGEDFTTELFHQSYLQNIPFVTDVTNIAETDGNRVYCIVPADETVTVTVSKYEYDENDVPAPGMELISANTPILVRGNIAEFVPNLHIRATRNTATNVYIPAHTGVDAKMDNSAGIVFDFSPYDVLPEFRIQPGDENGFCGSWVTVFTNENGRRTNLLLYLHTNGIARYSYGTETIPEIEWFEGSWELNGSVLKIKMEGGEGGMQSPVREINASFTWDTDGVSLFLTHVGGDELLSGTQGKTLDFWVAD